MLRSRIDVLFLNLRLWLRATEPGISEDLGQEETKLANICSLFLAHTQVNWETTRQPTASNKLHVVKIPLQPLDTTGKASIKKDEGHLYV